MVTRGTSVTLGVVAVGLLLSGCSAASTGAWAPRLSLVTGTDNPTSQATISAQIASPAQLDQPIVITASQGRLADVTVTGPKGALKGTLSPDATTWTADTGDLAYGAQYAVSATAVDSRGASTTSSSSFRTIRPKHLVHASVSPSNGSTVGVGTPITVNFDAPVKDRAAVENAMIVRTPTALTGAWAWKSDTQAIFRPQEYWPGHIPVQVDINLLGVTTGKGAYGAGDETTSFTTGPAMIIKVDAATDHAHVYRDGELIRTIPVTTGKPGFETRSGTLIITTKETQRIMDAATGGTDKTDPEYYRLMVRYAMRITNSGEFLHAAPWSVGSQGRANVSHGCVGMSTENAQWLFDNASLGDVVEITGTSVPQNLGNGVTVWTETWDQWLAQSSNGAVQTVADPSLAPEQAPGPTASQSASPTASPSAVAG